MSTPYTAADVPVLRALIHRVLDHELLVGALENDPDANPAELERARYDLALARRHAGMRP